MGWSGLIIVLSFCATYYTTSIDRTTTRVRDDMTREVAKKGLKADVESATWLNLFMTRFWLIYEPVLSATIIASVDQVLSVSCPSFLDSIRMTTFTLGTKPPHIDHVRTFAETDDDVVMMEWKISFVPNDILDMTKRMADKKVNPKVVISIGVGIGPAVVHKDIIVEDIMFTGTMRIKLKLMNNFPHVQTLDLSFMQPPSFDFSLNPVGFDLSIIPGLKPFIFSQVHASLGPMMYAPNTFTLNLEQMLSGAPIDTAVGVLALTIYSAKGLKGNKLGGGTPDPYVALDISGRDPIAKTSVKKSTTSPNWGKKETKFILLNNLTEVLNFVVMDWNEHRPDTTLGTATLDLKSLMEDGQQEGNTAEVIFNGSSRGSLKYDAIFSPVLTPNKLPDGTVEPVPETSTGVVRLTVHQAKDLDPRGEQINPYFTASLNKQIVHKSQVLKRTANPIWERSAEFLVTDKKAAVIGIQLMDQNKTRGDGKLGLVNIKLTDIFEAKEKGLDWFPLTGARSGRLRVSAEWKAVAMAGAINGAAGYTPPIGTVRLNFKRARDVKNVEAITGGKSDPYARVLSGGIVVARTEIFNNNLNPDFDEIVYGTVHSAKDTFVIELMDYQHRGHDRTLGQTTIKVDSLLKEGTDKKLKPWEGTGVRSFREQLSTDGGRSKKGTVEFEAEFFPSAHLKDITFTPPEASEIKEEGEVADAATKDSAELAADKEMAESEGIVIPKEQLMKAQSGILAFHVVSGNVAKKGARLEVLFDDAYWPTYSTEPARSNHAVWDEIGETFVRELDFSQVILKLNTADKETSEDIVGQVTIDANEFLERCLNQQSTFTLTTPSGQAKSTITLACAYIPVEIQLLPKESINNSGNLRVDLLDAKGLPSADRSGKSDPYAVFELNGEKVWKSEIQKKTLNPSWNQFFEVQVPSREDANFMVKIYDWDRVGTATKLCEAKIDLRDLEPIEQKDVAITLKDVKMSKDGGTANLKLLFRPAFLSRTRGATSTFSAGRIGTGLGAIGGGVIGAGGSVLGAGVTGVGSVGKGVGAVGKGAFGGLKHAIKGGHSGSADKNLSADGPQVTPKADAAETFPPSPSDGAEPGEKAANGSGNTTPNSQAGVITATVTKVTGLDVIDEKCYVILRHNGKSIGHTKSDKGDRSQTGNPISYDESFKLKPDPAASAADPYALEFHVLHHKLIGSDPVIGTCAVDNVHDVVGPSRSPSNTVTLPLMGGNGSVEVTLSWTAAHGFLNSPAGKSVVDRDDVGSVSPSTRSRGKFSRFSAHLHRSPKIEQE